MICDTRRIPKVHRAKTPPESHPSEASYEQLNPRRVRQHTHPQFPRSICICSTNSGNRIKRAMSVLEITTVTVKGSNPRSYPEHDTVRIRNASTLSINPEGYTIEFDSKHQHTLSEFQVESNADILVLSGTSGTMILESDPPIYVRPAGFDDASVLSDQGGEVVLRDPEGEAVDRLEYSVVTE